MKLIIYKWKLLLAIVFMLMTALAVVPAHAVLADGGITVDVYVKDSGGNPLSGAVIYNGPGSLSFGTTDGTGHASKVFPAGTTNLEVWAKWNNTSSPHQTQDISVNPTFNFQTINVTLRLETCGGTPLNSGKPRYGLDGIYTTWWWPGGLTGSGSNPAGESKAEIFPGTYSFEMQYLTTATAKVSVAIPNANTTLIWQTTKVTLNYSGLISYGGSGDSTWFTKPSMELLQGTYRFHFRDGGYADLMFSGCSLEKTIAVVRVLNGDGNGISGATAQWWDNSEPPSQIPGSTDTNGTLLEIMDGKHTDVSIQVTYGGVTTDPVRQDPTINSFYVFRLVFITIDANAGTGFVKVDGTPITTPKTFSWVIGSTHNLEALSPVAGPASTQYVFTGWSDGKAQTHDYTVPNAAATVTANYKTQYYLTVNSAYGTTGGAGWYDLGSPAAATVTPLIVPGASGVQYVFIGWSGDASGTTSPSNPITMDGPKTATANWKTQYYLTLATNPASLPVTLNGAGWYDANTSPTISTNSPVVYNSDSYAFTGWTTADMAEIGSPSALSTTVLTDKAKTVTANYVKMVNITVTSNPVTGTGFVKVDDNLVTTPQTFSWVAGSTHKLEALSPVAGPPGTNYHWVSWSDGGSQTHNYIVPGTAQTVTANYNTVTLKPIKYQLISYSYLDGKTIFQESLKVCIANQGSINVKTVKATISYLPAYVTVIDGDVTLGNINAGGSILSGDTYTIKVKLVPPPNPSDTITWKITYYIGSSGPFTLDNVPQ